MKKIFISTLFVFSFLSALPYCAGEQVSIAHQNEGHEVGAGADGYATGDSFSLADYNGDLNGGQYHVILIDMSASW
jgi:hypothetical protein